MCARMAAPNDGYSLLRVKVTPSRSLRNLKESARDLRVRRAKSNENVRACGSANDVYSLLRV